MKYFSKLLLAGALLATSLSASNLFTQVASMKKGTDGYIIGQELSQNQIDMMKKNFIQSNNPKVVKFLDGNDLLVAVNKSNNKVIAINKRFNQITQDKIKGLIGGMIHDFDEPTAMAHDKMIYWIFDDKGNKLSEDDLKAWKDNISGKVTASMALAEAVNKKKKEANFNPYVSVKLQSDQPMMSKMEEPKLANAYLMISSDKLIKATTGIK